MIQKLLIENGFYPCILRDPIMFGGYYGVSELVDEVKEGILYFLSLTQNSSAIQLNRRIGNIHHLINHSFDNIKRYLKSHLFLKNGINTTKYIKNL